MQVWWFDAEGQLDQVFAVMNPTGLTDKVLEATSMDFY